MRALNSLRQNPWMPYLPEHDRVDDRDELLAFIAAHPLAALITHDGTTPQNDLVPLLALPDDESPTGITLIGHIARANPLWHEGRHEGLALASFGPVDHYITPSWYPSKLEHHRTVPTWNYLIAHAWGELRIHHDRRFLLSAVGRLTVAMERPREVPWRMNQAPREYTEELLEQIVGISIPVARLEGRFKVSAQKPDADRLGARDGVAAEHGSPELVRGMTEPPQGTDWGQH